MRLHEKLRLMVDGLPHDSGSGVHLSRDGILAMLAEDAADAAQEQDARMRLDPDVGAMCRLFGKSASTVRGWIRSGELKAYLDGKTYRATPDDIEAFKLKRRQGRKQKTHATGTVPDIGEWRRTG